MLLGNGDGTFQPAVTYPSGAYSTNSVAIGDVNGDGIPDLVAASWCGTIGQSGCDNQVGAVSVLLGNGDGTFQSPLVLDSGGYYAYCVALADLRGNGKMDLVVTNISGVQSPFGSVGVLLGNGDGTFQPAVAYDTGAEAAASVAIGDLTGDGVPDLVVADYAGSVSVLLGNGDGTFQPAVTYGSGGRYPSSIGLGILQANGILDVVVSNSFNSLGSGKGVRELIGVLLGKGDGTFQTAVSYVADGVGGPSWPLPGSGVDSLVVADVNGDGIPDVVSAEPCQILQGNNCIGNKDVSVLLGSGDGALQSPAAFSSGGFLAWGVAVADVNGDGRPDLLVANSQVAPYNSDGSVAVLLNTTSYTTKTAITASPNPSLVNQTVTFTATITSNPPVPNGEIVTFSQGTTKLGTGATTNGVASLSTSFSKAKDYYTIKARYPGDAFRKASSGTVMEVVNP